MPIVKVSWLAGRSHEQRVELAKVITEAVARIGQTSADATIVIFEDVAKENWAQGGTLMADKAGH